MNAVVALAFDPDEWGTVADWVEAVATAVAFLVAALAFRHEIELRHAQDEEDGWLKARDVWLSVTVSAGQRPSRSGRGGVEAYADAVIAWGNQGIRDVEDARVAVWYGDRKLFESLEGGLPAGIGRDRKVPLVWDPADLQPPGGFGAELTWFDRRGRRWRRTAPDGALTRLPKAKPYQ